MGSLDAGVFAKRGPLLPSSSRRSDRHLQRHRSRLWRILRFEKVDYFQWVFIVVVFFFVIVLFQLFLPGSSAEKSGSSGNYGLRAALAGSNSQAVRVDFGDGIRFHPSKLLEKFRREANSSAALSRPGIRAALRKPLLAVVLPDMSMDGMQLLMVSLAKSLQQIGYDFQAYALDDGPIRGVWQNIGIPVNILKINKKGVCAIDWLIYDGVLVNSLEAKDVVSCLLQEPFRSLPLIWTAHEMTLALRSRNYSLDWQIRLNNDWKRVFNRATVVAFPNYYLPMMYSAYDSGNFFVIPGFASEALEAERLFSFNKENNSRDDMGYDREDLVVAVVGSQFLYSGLWVEHTLVLQSLLPLLSNSRSDTLSNSHFKVGILSGNATSAYKVALEAIALNLGFPQGSVQQIGVDGDFSSFLHSADLVVYGSFLEEQSFPPILVQAMCLGKIIIAPDLAMITNYVDDGVNGYLFPKNNVGALSQILSQIISSGTVAPLAGDVASMGKSFAKNLMVAKTLEGYASLLENVLKLPPEVSNPKSFTEIPVRLKEEWQWTLFYEITDLQYLNRIFSSYRFLEKVECLWNQYQANRTTIVQEAFSITDWEDERAIQMANVRKRREEEELKERMDQPRGTWEDVYRNAKKADRSKNELHERDERELERTGQPLCIYESFLGEGSWPFLHNTSLYRGIGLSTKGRRPGADDIDAPSRLPILSDPYYRDILGEYGAFFAMANRVDRIHKNAWIGFQSWRATARRESLSKEAEKALLEAIETRKHGDALFFWVRMDKDPRNPLKQDFWSFCDSLNAGNCKFVVSEALGRMYGIKDSKQETLPPMPNDGGSWSVLHSWALPTRSFLEFVMFSRMFVDALDTQMYDEHHQSGHCSLSLYTDRHCYSRVLELMVNVWTYHSARRIIYVDPETGIMTEHHRLQERKGKMWVKWFSFSTLKSMDEDLAEEFDLDKLHHRWLWPSTGEVFWQGIYERERNLRQKQKEKRKQQSRDKISRIRRRHKQKTIGKYVKPLPDAPDGLNATVTTDM